MRWLALFSLVGPLAAQGVVSSVRVEAIPAGALFFVDGQAYKSSQTFFWTAGSKHVLEAPPDPTALSQPVEYRFNEWRDSTGQLTASSRRFEIIASPRFTQFQVTFTRLYRVEYDFEPGSGTLVAAGIAVPSSRATYYPENFEVALNAIPAPGWVFQGWEANNPERVPAIRIVVRAPRRFHPIFGRGRRATITTDPPGRQVFVDRTPVATPYSTDWAFEATYQLGAPSPQRDSAGRLWAFDRWSFGGGQNSSYTVRESGDIHLTGTFVRAATAAFFTDPPGLRINVDGRENYLSYEFNWPVDTVHTVEAAEEQIDANGRRLVFTGWSNGGARQQTLALTLQDADTGRVTWVAKYAQLPRLTLEAPAGVTFEVDGAPCAAPCRLDRTAGSTISVRAPGHIALSDDSGLQFIRWSDGSSADRQISLNTDQQLYADYRRAHRITATSAPSDAGEFFVDPGEFVPEGDIAQIRVVPAPGYRFRNWDGDAYGTQNPLVMPVPGPRKVRALLERSPYVDTAGVRNAAGDTPEEIVAPGSRVILTGLNLATSTVIAEGGPRQSLDDVIVTWNGHLLPLIAVSPEMIQTILPWAMPDGERKLEIRRTGYPVIVAPAQVVRNAPGLYPVVIRGAGSRVSILATGLGPVSPVPFDGFPAPPNSGAAFEDQVQVEVDEAPVPHDSLRLSSDLAGIAVIELALPPDAKTLRVRVNGRVSNTINLEPDPSLAK